MNSHSHPTPSVLRPKHLHQPRPNHRNLAQRSTHRKSSLPRANPLRENTLDATTPSNNTTFYGYLYNWCSAMGGQQNAYDNTSTTGFDTTESICPAGWRLPTGGTDATTDWKNLTNAIGATPDAIGSSNFQNDFLAVYSGLYLSSLAQQDTYGYYWSSTVYSATNVFFLNFTSTHIYAATNPAPKYAGIPVRCVF